MTSSTRRILVDPSGLRASPLTPPVSKSDAQRALVLGHLTGAWPLPSVQAEPDEDLPADVRVLRRGVDALRLPPGPVRVTIRAAAAGPRRGLADVIREIRADQVARGFHGLTAEQLRQREAEIEAENDEYDREMEQLGALPPPEPGAV